MSRLSGLSKEQISISNRIIFCGRGKAFATHPGNCYFQKTIGDHVGSYIASRRRGDSRAETHRIIFKKIHDHIVEDMGMIFLKLTSRRTEWTALERGEIMKKIGHALRDAKAIQTKPLKSKGKVEQKMYPFDNGLLIEQKSNPMDEKAGKASAAKDQKIHAGTTSLRSSQIEEHQNPVAAKVTTLFGQGSENRATAPPMPSTTSLHILNEPLVYFTFDGEPLLSRKITTVQDMEDLAFLDKMLSSRMQHFPIDADSIQIGGDLSLSMTEWVRQEHLRSSCGVRARRRCGDFTQNSNALADRSEPNAKRTLLDYDGGMKTPLALSQLLCSSLEEQITQNRSRPARDTWLASL